MLKFTIGKRPFSFVVLFLLMSLFVGSVYAWAGGCPDKPKRSDYSTLKKYREARDKWEKDCEAKQLVNVDLQKAFADSSKKLTLN